MSRIDRGARNTICRHPWTVDLDESPWDGPTLTFARNGASRREPADSREAYALALRLGAGGVETTARVTVDGTVALSGRAHVGSRLRRRSFETVTSADLPEHVITLDALLALQGPEHQLLLHVADQPVFEAVVRTLAERGDEIEQRVWLASTDLARLIAWRPQTSCRLLLCVPPRKLPRGIETLAAELRSVEVDGLGLFHLEWTPGHVAVLHRFGRCTYGWGAEHERELANLFRFGLDIVSSDHADRLAAVASSFST